MKKILAYLRMCLKNAKVRLNLAMLFGIVFNVFYIIFNLVSGIIYSDAWPIAVAAYYMLILSLRYLIISNNDADGGSLDLRVKERNAGVVMLIFGIPITGMMIYSVVTDSVVEYSGAVPLVLAIYSAVSVIRAVIAAIRIRESDGTVIRIAYTVRILAASMSVFNLQSAILSLLDISPTAKAALKFIGVAAASISLFSLPLRLVKGEERSIYEKTVAKK
ncbi:MAG: hypothetical protein J6V09_03940 [Clostridia bacterium]|nr:hypothetical protein [Clostridia bacterium]